MNVLHRVTASHEVYTVLSLAAVNYKCNESNSFMKKSFYLLLVVVMAVTGVSIAENHEARSFKSLTDSVATSYEADSLTELVLIVDEAPDTIGVDSLANIDPSQRHGRLTEQDYIEVAEELGVEVAAIKAVVEIEAGKAHKGFWAENKPIINFDLSVFKKMATKNKVSLAEAQEKYPVIFAKPNIAKYGSQQAGQQARLDAAREFHDLSGIEGTFWGMFQLGGFNWKICGTESPQQFVDLMSRSERDQLELFATFMKNTGLLKYLKNKNWSAFARQYNGPGYAKRGYHTRMAKAYNKFKNK